MSKGLELQTFINEMTNKLNIKKLDKECIAQVFWKNKYTLEKMVKPLQAIDIIKKKNVDIQRLMKCINVATYNNGLPKNRQLTQEEFNLLKEVLGE